MMIMGYESRLQWDNVAARLRVQDMLRWAQVQAPPNGYIIGTMIK